MNANAMNSNDDPSPRSTGPGDAGPGNAGSTGSGGGSGDNAGPSGPDRSQREAAGGTDANPAGATGPEAGPATPPGVSSPGPAWGVPPGPGWGVPPSPGTVYAAPRQNFFDWIRSHGIYRGDDRWIGGVASGIAHRAGIDPLIVRGIFIVLALFAGIGVLLYGLAWAFLPEPDGRIHVQDAASGRWSAGMTGAVITTLIGLPGLGRGFWSWNNGGWGFFWALLWISLISLFIYYLIQRNRNRTGAGRMNPEYPAGRYPGSQSAGAYAAGTYGGAAYSAPAGAAPGGGTASAGYPSESSTTAPRQAAAHTPEASPQTDATSEVSGGHASVPSYQAPPYSPSGTYTPSRQYPPSGPYPSSGQYPPSVPVPPAGDVPGRPGPAQPRPRRTGPGSGMVAITAGAALLTGGTLKALDAGNVIDLGDAANAVVWASGAAILGLGIVIAGLRGRTSGLMGFLAIVALVVGAFFNFVPRGDRFAFHDADWTPASIQQAQSGFEITGGRGTVDLRSLGLTAPLTSDVVVPLDVTASNITVLIPNSVPVEVQADMAFGRLNQNGGDRGGQFNDLRTQYNTDKGGARLIVKINGAMSNVTIQEGT